jgi:hypothetical protein
MIFLEAFEYSKEERFEPAEGHSWNASVEGIGWYVFDHLFE